MKTISENLREHALGAYGGYPFGFIEPVAAWSALMSMKRDLQTSEDLTPDERRMFCLFGAEALEQS